MGTRAVYTFLDEQSSFSVYGHWDGYPSSAAEKLCDALPYAWTLPRFEAMDFAAAFVAANKKVGGGGIYLTYGPGYHADLEYHYKIRAGDSTSIIVEVYEVEYDENGSQRRKRIFKGMLSKMVSQYCNKKED